MTPTGNALDWSPSWRLERTEHHELELSAGADRRLLLRGIDDTLATAALGWACGSPVTVTAAEARLADQLVAVGALVVRRSTASVELIGDEVLATKLAGAMELESDPSGTAVLLRTCDGWPAPPARPHLAVDVSMHHTIVLGPYVVPGLTACTSCLDTRVQRRWAPAPAPAQPAVQRHVHVIAELVRLQLELIQRGSSPLVNATIAWDLETGTTDRQTLLKSPGCATCDVATATGRLTLPWARGAQS